jgi:hypothetical protein
MATGPSSVFTGVPATKQILDAITGLDVVVVVGAIVVVVVGAIVVVVVVVVELV